MLEEFRYKTAVHYILGEMQAEAIINKEQESSMIGVATNSINLFAGVSAIRSRAVDSRFGACVNVFSGVLAVLISKNGNNQYDEDIASWSGALDMALKLGGLEDDGMRREKKNEIMHALISPNLIRAGIDPSRINELIFSIIRHQSTADTADAMLTEFRNATKRSLETGRLTDDVFASMVDLEYNDHEIAVVLLDLCVTTLKNDTRDMAAGTLAEITIETLERSIDYIMMHHPGREMPRNGLWAIAAEAYALNGPTE